MKILFVVIVAYYCLTHVALGRKGFGPTDQEWGFVTVRPGAQLFWWLHKTRAPVENYLERPLVIWLQGGPGASSTAFGNFVELGPLDLNLNERNTTWINEVNVLFVDNPVGTGYSYVNSLSDLTTKNREIAEDFLVLMQGFYEALPELKNTPLYIFSESYGGKMTAEIALILDQAIKNGSLEANLVGVGLGDSWISPVDSIMTWAPYLLQMGVVDQKGFEKIQEDANSTKEAVEAGDFITAITYWSKTANTALKYTENVDFYNVLTKIVYNETKTMKISLPRPLMEHDEELTIIMNGVVKEALGLDVSWGSQSTIVFEALAEDYLKPVTNIVEELLNKTDIKVAIYSGQLDIVADTPGTLQWVNKLKFPQADDWKTAVRQPLVVDNIIEGFYKEAGKLTFYWVNRAGHMVPADNPAAMHFILDQMTNGFASTIED